MFSTMKVIIFLKCIVLLALASPPRKRARSSKEISPLSLPRFILSHTYKVRPLLDHQLNTLDNSFVEETDNREANDASVNLLNEPADNRYAQSDQHDEVELSSDHDDKLIAEDEDDTDMQEQDGIATLCS